MAKRIIILCITIICILNLSSCSAQSEKTSKDNKFKPYQKVSLLTQEPNFSPDEIKKYNEEIKKNLMGLNGLSDQEAEQLIQNGKFENRYVEAGNSVTNNKIDCKYIASALITVWKSEDYFAICNTEEASFIPYIGDQEIDMVGSDAWSDVEDGYLKPHNKNAGIVVVIGRTGSLNAEDVSIAPSKLYLEKISISY